MVVPDSGLPSDVREAISDDKSPSKDTAASATEKIGADEKTEETPTKLEGAALVLIAKLIDPRTKQEYEIYSNPFTVGRGSANQLKLNSGAMSRVHFMIYRKRDEFYLDDLGSTNGTYLNGKEVDCLIRLKDGVEVEVKSRPDHPRDGWRAVFRLMYRAVAPQIKPNGG